LTEFFFEFLMPNALATAIILSAAAFQAERRISRYECCVLREIPRPPVKRRLFGVTPFAI
jgi:hypothetical protein